MPPISQRLHWHQQKNILRDLNNSGMAATSPRGLREMTNLSYLAV
jgi:hypothetical protein